MLGVLVNAGVRSEGIAMKNTIRRAAIHPTTSSTPLSSFPHTSRLSCTYLPS